jgi:hypothetical protein
MNGSYDVQRDGYTQKPASIREEIAGSDAPAAKAPEQREYLSPEAAGVPSLPEVRDVQRAGRLRLAFLAVL